MNDIILSNIQTREEYEILLNSGAIPKALNTPEKLMTVVQTGKEFGLAPMVSINNINVIEGKTCLSAALLGALLKRANIEWIWTKDHSVESEKIVTELKFRYKSILDNSVIEQSWSVTWGQFQLAGYTEKPNWKKYPKEMLRSRCLSSGARYIFPEIILGYYVDDEIVDATPNSEDKYDIIIDEAGQTRVVEKENK